MIACRHLLSWLLSAFRSRQDLILENLALRQQLLAFHAQRPRRRLTAPHQVFWVGLRKVWAHWKGPLILVTPRTVVGWHRAGFRLYWKWLSRARPDGGRKPVSKETRALIFQMVVENPTCAPRIHGELLMLGFDVSEPTVSRWLRRAPRPPDPSTRWLTFLRNHREAIAAMDFFTVPKLTFGILYCFFVIAHDRRRILHCDVTRNPNALWANEVGLLSAADHDRLTADYERHPREAAGALAKGTVIRDLLLSIFAGFANGRSVSSQRLSELNSALAQAPGLLRVMKKSDRIETEWMSTAQGLSQVFFCSPYERSRTAR